MKFIFLHFCFFPTLAWAGGSDHLVKMLITGSGSVGSAIEIGRAENGQSILLSASHNFGNFLLDPVNGKETTQRAFRFYESGQGLMPAEMVFLRSGAGKPSTRVASFFRPLPLSAGPEMVVETLMPESDFSLIVNTQVETGPEAAQVMAQTQLPKFLPSITFATPKANQSIHLVGFGSARSMSEIVSNSGVVVDDSVAEKIIAQTRSLQNTVPAFDSSIEFLVFGEATPGMSGGAVFDESGNALGVIVRSGQSTQGRYVRVVKADFIFEQIGRERFPASVENYAQAAMKVFNQGVIPVSKKIASPLEAVVRSSFRSLIQSTQSSDAVNKSSRDFANALMRFHQSNETGNSPELTQLLSEAKIRMEKNGVAVRLQGSPSIGLKPRVDVRSLGLTPIDGALQANVHPLNDLAFRLKSNFGLELIYDPDALKSSRALGMVFRHAIYLSDAFIEKVGADSTFLHEISHALMQAMRKNGMVDDIFSLDLGQPFSNGGYRFGSMSAEELLAHAVSVRIAVWELKILDRRFEQQLKKLTEKVENALEVSKIAMNDLPHTIAVMKAALRDQGPVKVLLKNRPYQGVFEAYSLSGPLVVFEELPNSVMVMAVPAEGRRSTVDVFNRELVKAFRDSPAAGIKAILVRSLEREEKLLKIAVDQEKNYSELLAVLKASKNPNELIQFSETVSTSVLKKVMDEAHASSAQPSSNARELQLPEVLKAELKSDSIENMHWTSYCDSILANE